MNRKIVRLLPLIAALLSFGLSAAANQDSGTSFQSDGVNYELVGSSWTGYTLNIKSDGKDIASVPGGDNTYEGRLALVSTIELVAKAAADPHSKINFKERTVDMFGAKSIYIYDGDKLLTVQPPFNNGNIAQIENAIKAAARAAKAKVDAKYEQGCASQASDAAGSLNSDSTSAASK